MKWADEPIVHYQPDRRGPVFTRRADELTPRMQRRLLCIYVECPGVERRCTLAPGEDCWQFNPDRAAQIAYENEEGLS